MNKFNYTIKTIVIERLFMMLKSKVEVSLSNIFKSTCLDRNIVVVLNKINKDIVLIFKFTLFNAMKM
jgi:hypothetical protein